MFWPRWLPKGQVPRQAGSLVKEPWRRTLGEAIAPSAHSGQGVAVGGLCGVTSLSPRGEGRRGRGEGGAEKGEEGEAGKGGNGGGKGGGRGREWGSSVFPTDGARLKHKNDFSTC